MNVPYDGRATQRTQQAVHNLKLLGHGLPHRLGPQSNDLVDQNVWGKQIVRHRNTRQSTL